jgi:glycosyltransferase involved in cell wall biosynthesis
MTKLIIQIPSYNEAETIAVTLKELPRELAGIDRIERIVIDDGSSDGTAQIALRNGADHVVQLAGHQGLARGFMAGIEAALSLGADIIVNTDADNQYQAADIGKLVAPILAGDADIVIGARPIADIAHFSLTKKILQRIGSAVVRLASGTEVEDAPSGFRAISREAAMRLHVFGEYTYTIETIIQAGQNGMRVLSVPVRTNPELRKSRLIKSVPRYILRSVATIGRIFLIYRPLRLFLPLSAVLLAGGTILGLRYLYYWLSGEGLGHVQSVILGTTLLGMGTVVFLIGIVADLIATNRKLLERLDARLWRIERGVGLGLAERAAPTSSGATANPEPARKGGSHEPPWAARR